MSQFPPFHFISLFPCATFSASTPPPSPATQAALGVILEDASAKDKPSGVFGSFGWSGEAIDEIQQRLKDAGFSFAFPAIRCKFKVRGGRGHE